MTNRDCAVLAFKLLGVWFVATALIAVARAPAFWDPSIEVTLVMAGVLLPAVMSFAVGYALWFAAGRLSTRVFPAAPSAVLPADPVGGPTVFAIGLSLIGALMTAESIPMLVNGVALFLQSREAGADFLGPDLAQQELIWTAAARANVAAAASRFIIGVVLLAGPARLTAAFTRVRKEWNGSADEDSEQGKA